MGANQIKEWQSRIGVKVDGDFGPTTLAASLRLLPKVLEPVSDAPWMAIAKKEMGQKEVIGGENPRIIEYHSATTLSADEDEVPWCSAFVCWCLGKVGYKSTKSAWARSYENYGQKLDSPKSGCIVVFDWKDGSGHVGFVTSWATQTVTVLGGNQSDSVCLATFSRKNVSAFRWPVKA